MRLSALPCLLLVAPLSLTGAAAPADTASSRTVLRGPDCLDPDFVRGWHTASDGSLFVDAGRRKYRLQVDPTCIELGHSAGIRFRTGGVPSRVCGHIGDAVLVRGRSCRIDRIELVDAGTWRDSQAWTRTTVTAGAGSADP